MNAALITYIFNALVLTSISPFDVILEPEKPLCDPDIYKQIWLIDCSYFGGQCKIYNYFYKSAMGVIVGTNSTPTEETSIVQLVNFLNNDPDTWRITGNGDILLMDTDLTIEPVHGKPENKQLWLKSLNNTSSNRSQFSLKYLNLNEKL